MIPPGGWPNALIQYLGIELWRIPLVIVSAIAIYLTFYLLIQFFGARILTGATSFDAAVIIMLGAVAGRVVIGHPPTLAAGIIGLVTLVLLEVLFGALHTALAQSKERRMFPRGLNKKPVVVWAHGQRVEKFARRARVSGSDLAHAFRRAGVSSAAEVQCAVLEPNGAISVIRTGQPIDPVLLEGVVGADLLAGD